MKRKRIDAVKATEDDLPAALAAYGERFLSTFDDYESTEVHTAVGKLTKQPAHPIHNQQTAGGSDDAPNERSVVEVFEKDASINQAAAAAGKPAAQQATPISKLDKFLSRKKGNSSAETSQSRKEQQQQEAQQRLLEHKLKKHFMSSKVSKIFDDVKTDHMVGAVAAAAAAAADARQGDDLTAEDFAAMKRDVEMLGASALDKRAAKAWKAAMLAKLGASADRAPRTPAKIGLGMASKAKQREAAALQEAIAAGMIKAKGRGKKLRALKEKQREKGLMEAGPGFKNGVLRLKQPR